MSSHPGHEPVARNNFLYDFKHPAALRSAGRASAPLRAPLLPPARSARAAPTRAHEWVGLGYERRASRDPLSKQCLRRGRSGSEMDGALFAGTGRV